MPASNQTRVSKKQFLLLSVMLLTGRTVAAADDAKASKSKAASELSIPDINQRQFSNGNLCGPSAVSNILVQLSPAQPLLFPPQHDLVSSYPTKDSQVALAQLLSEPAYMDTVKYDGTSRTRIINGLGRYLLQQGVKDFQIGYDGIRDINMKMIDSGLQSHLQVNVIVPTMELVQSHLQSGQGVVMNWGAYEPGETAGTFLRKGGHYVTVVGSGKDAKGRPQPDAIIIHDPNDGFIGKKYVAAQVHEEKLNLNMSEQRKEILQPQGLIELKNAGNHYKDRPCFFESLFTLEVH